MNNNGHRMYANFTDTAWEAMKNGNTMFNNGFRSNEGNFFPEQPIFTEIVGPEDNADTLVDMVDVKAFGLLAAALAVGYGISKRKEIKEWVTDKAVPGIKKVFSVSGKDEKESVYEQTSVNRDSEPNGKYSQKHHAEVIDFESYSERRNKTWRVEKAN